MLYEYRCSSCGPFDAHVAGSSPASGAACPSCGAAAERMFSAPGGRGPKRQRQLQGLSPAALGHVERAQVGAVSIGPLPAGAAVARGGRPMRSRPRADERRPWQIGH
ncbi:MAG: zinc ribbon domain-containing protein [Solirubrobacteraceae bacterium]